MKKQKKLFWLSEIVKCGKKRDTSKTTTKENLHDFIFSTTQNNTECLNIAAFSKLPTKKVKKQHFTSDLGTQKFEQLVVNIFLDEKIEKKNFFFNFTL